MRLKTLAKGLGWAVLALVLVTPSAMYLLNPFGTASRDPRARILGYTAFRMPSQSMEPTLPNGTLFLVDAAALRNRDPHVGEIIAFQYPLDPEVAYVKRVIAAGGSTVEMRRGVVWLDGRKLDEPWLPASPITSTTLNGVQIPLGDDFIYADFPPTHVPEHQFFVLGDNRGNSEDSRAWGFVPRNLVIGIYARSL